MCGLPAHSAGPAALPAVIELPGFEGVEKRLELSFAPSAANRLGACGPTFARGRVGDAPGARPPAANRRLLKNGS